jgi:hypothetical protein
MQQEHILTYTDESGQSRSVPILKHQFTIGRGADNDLVISNSKLSRRHALIEVVSGSHYVSDTGSQNGTFVNNRTVVAPIRLTKGDIISLGGGCDLTFNVEAPGRAQRVPPPGASPDSPARVTATPEPSPASAPAQTSSLVPLIAGGAIGLILLAAIVVVAIAMMQDKPRPEVSNLAIAEPGNGIEPGKSKVPNPTPSDNENVPATTASPGKDSPRTLSNDSDEEIGRAAQRVMSRISKDESPYISASGIKDVAAKVREYKGSGTLASKLRAMSRGCVEINSLAQANSLKPALLSYAAIAASDGAGDPVASAKQMAPKLLTLRATFGTDSANSTLLLLAAYPYPFNPQLGSQTRTAHPLASKLVELGGRRSVEDTSVARTVWFLKEKNGIMPEAYELVVRFLAVGIISQDPRSFGVDAEPLFC